MQQCVCTRSSRQSRVPCSFARNAISPRCYECNMYALATFECDSISPCHFTRNVAIHISISILRDAARPRIFKGRFVHGMLTASSIWIFKQGEREVITVFAMMALRRRGRVMKRKESVKRNWQISFVTFRWLRHVACNDNFIDFIFILI